MGYHLRVKICGVTTPADAAAAAHAGADAVGLNFYPNSVRYLADDQTIQQILKSLPPFVDAVGVYVVEAWDQALLHAQNHGLRSIQMHGDRHDPAGRFPFHRIDAFRIASTNSLNQVDAYLAAAELAGHPPAAVLLDGHTPGQYGGAGARAPWALLADFRPPVPIFLAGGLTPENVAEAVQIVRPYGIDVAGGVESTPGRKDPEKLRRFIENARAAAASL
jgi:phosphoribosylanthranilate isomerase